MRQRIEYVDPRIVALRSHRFSLSLTLSLSLSVSMQRDFIRNEERRFASFCGDLEREYAILAEPAVQRQRTMDEVGMRSNRSVRSSGSADSEVREHDESDGALFDFKLHSLLKMERDFAFVMEENLKMDGIDTLSILEYRFSSKVTFVSHWNPFPL